MKNGKQLKTGKQFIKYLHENGVLVDYEQEWLQQGMQQVFALLEKGYSPAEAKKKLQMTH